MKKIILILSILLLTIIMTSCNDIVLPLPGLKEELDIFMEKEIVLGEEVSSLKVLNNQGKEINIDYSLSFLKLYNSLNPFFLSKNNKIVSYYGELKGEDDTKDYIHMSVYKDDSSSLYHYETMKEDNEDVATIMQYSYSGVRKDENGFDNDFVMKYEKYTYKEEKAFFGIEQDNSSTVRYKNSNYPLVPEVGSELGDMQIRATNLNFLLSFISSTNLFFEYPVIVKFPESFDINESIKSEYKLYENYIVFEQDNPYFGLSSPYFFPSNVFELCMKIKNEGYSNKICAYYNVNTNEFEMMTMVGKTYFKGTGKMIDINIIINVFDLDETKYRNKVESLVVYVRGNATKETN